MARQTVIGNLQIRLTAVTKQFDKGLGSSLGRLRSFQRFLSMDWKLALARAGGAISGLFLKGLMAIPSLVGRAITSLLRLARTLSLVVVGAATAAAAALAALARSSAQNIDRLAKTSDKLGITTENLAVFELAAADAGVDTKKLELGLQRMTRRVSEAARGMGEAQGALKELRLNARELNRLTPDQIFLRVAEAMSKVGAQSDKIRLAFKLFDSEGVDLVRLFGENLEEAQRWADLLGLTISRFDARKVEEANKSVDRLKLAFTGVGNVLATRVAPLVKSISDRALAFVEAQGGVASIVESVIQRAANVTLNFLNRVGLGLQNVRDFASTAGFDRTMPAEATMAAIQGLERLIQLTITLGSAFRAVWLSFKSFALSAFVGASTLMTAFVGRFGEIVNLLPGVNLDTQFFEDFTNDLIQQTADAAAEASKAWGFVFGGGMIRASERVSDAMRPLADAAGGFVQATTDTGIEFFKRVESGALNAGGALAAVRSEILRVNEALMALGALEPLIDRVAAIKFFEEGLIFAPRGGPSQRIKDLDEQIKKSLEKINPYADEMQRIFARASDSISDHLASAIVRGEDLFKSLRDTALRVVEEILSAILRLTIIQPILGAFGLGGGGGGILGSIFGGAQLSGSRALGAPVAAGSIGGGVKIEEHYHTHFNGPVAGERQFEELALKAMQTRRGQSIIEGSSENRVKNVFAREFAPLGGR